MIINLNFIIKHDICIIAFTSTIPGQCSPSPTVQPPKSPHSEYTVENDQDDGPAPATPHLYRARTTRNLPPNHPSSIGYVECAALYMYGYECHATLHLLSNKEENYNNRENCMENGLESYQRGGINFRLFLYL